MELIGVETGSGGFNTQSIELIADVTPTALALNLYVRSQGSSKPPVEYWEGQTISIEQLDKENEEDARKEAEKRKQEKLAEKEIKKNRC